MKIFNSNSKRYGRHHAFLTQNVEVEVSMQTESVKNDFFPNEEVLYIQKVQFTEECPPAMKILLLFKTFY
jgi:hypothetical protein